AGIVAGVRGEGETVVVEGLTSVRGAPVRGATPEIVLPDVSVSSESVPMFAGGAAAAGKRESLGGVAPPEVGRLPKRELAGGSAMGESSTRASSDGRAAAGRCKAPPPAGAGREAGAAAAGCRVGVVKGRWAGT